MRTYKHEYCEQLRIHCENGKSLESFCAALGVSPKIISEWYNEHQEFQDAVDMAPCLELLYWEMTMVRALNNKDKESIMVAKSRLDNLYKCVTSPLKKNTYSDLKENPTNKKMFKSTGDLVSDYRLLIDKE